MEVTVRFYVHFFSTQSVVRWIFFVVYIVIKNDITDLYPADIALVVFVGLVPLVSMVISWLVWRVREDNSDTVYSQGVLLKNLEAYLNEKF